jgi:DNA adenine methylase
MHDKVILKNGECITPFLNWAGGKRWLVANYSHIFPSKYNTYIEPFLGSGAIYFALRPNKAILSDINEALIETYNAIKKHPAKVFSLLKKHHKHHCKEYYYLVRSSQPRTTYGSAAKFIYLNRTCWNGLYRVNQNGIFNVPIGTKTNVILDSDNFFYMSNQLNNIHISSNDYEAIIDKAKQNDFIFVDPPYTVKHNNNNFIKYNEQLFSWEDQIRLHKCLLKASKKGAIIMITNAYHECIRKLYRNDFALLPVKRKSIIASNSKNRGTVRELIIKNF